MWESAVFNFGFTEQSKFFILVQPVRLSVARSLEKQVKCSNLFSPLTSSELADCCYTPAIQGFGRLIGSDL